MASWNIAAINNNPFEYWITHDDAKYNELMDKVQQFISSPGDKDIAVEKVFTPKMFEDLKVQMQHNGWDGIEETAKRWEAEFRGRKIVSGFMKDKVLGKKRLASMPDRITNTIDTADGQTVYRPTVINCYDTPMDSVDEWWVQWKSFMFERKIKVRGKKGGAAQDRTPSSILMKIKKTKYPAITEEEEKISIPLQTMAQAIFDAILVHIVNTVSPGSWHQLRTQMCNALNKKKTERTISILQDTYSSSDVIFLQASL